MSQIMLVEKKTDTCLHLFSFESFFWITEYMRDNSDKLGKIKESLELLPFHEHDSKLQSKSSVLI